MRSLWIFLDRKAILQVQVFTYLNQVADLLILQSLTLPYPCQLRFF
jgi:hypothetical protein